MANPSRLDYPSVNASPVKSFFVSMLTRDIKLEDAILDLLDNCVDGILRSTTTTGTKPYKGYRAEIKLDGETFSISDNCGGIPWSLHHYAFRMGRAPDRPPDTPGSVGVYGIGMKRAIFKIGRHCLISTRNNDDQYEVDITPEWIEDQSQWEIPGRPATRSTDEDGTMIVVGDLYPGISKTFGNGGNAFQSDLDRLISTHYAYIIEKGFNVTVNGAPIEPRTTKIIYDARSGAAHPPIKPFVYKATVDAVDVYLAVGFTRPIPSAAEIADEQEVVKYSSIDAGWTILCNDRAVLHCDRTELTGWGEAGVPRYHTQFIAISGIVEFRSDDPKKLPTTTTKRGIDASSPLYLQIKNKMREGMRVFIEYTNRWKGRVDESKGHVRRVKTYSLSEIKKKTTALSFNSTRTPPFGSQYKPSLPLPTPLEPTMRRISFVKEVTKIKLVAEYLDDPGLDPSAVGATCFDVVYDEAHR